MKLPVLSAMRTILLIVLATCSLQVWGVDCSSSDITLSTQAEVDNFQVTYGGGGVCDTVTGNLVITGDDISDIDGIAKIINVTGSLTIKDDPALTNIDGLVKLTSVGEVLKISNNLILANLNGLANLVSVEGAGLVISFNSDLAEVNHLDKLANLGGSLNIASNGALTNIKGLNNLTSIGGSLLIQDNPRLVDINGLTNLASLVGSLGIHDNPALTNIDSLARLISVSVNLDIYANTTLGHCSALAPLLGWPGGPPDDKVGGVINVAATNDSGCKSVSQILDSVSGPTAPFITSIDAFNGSAIMEYLLSTTTDTLWVINSYYGKCLADENVTVQNNTTADIPDEGSVFSSLVIDSVSSETPDEWSLAVNITHPRTRHLILTLTSSSGKSILLWDQAVGDGTDLVGTFPTTLEPAESLDAFDGEDFNGEWQLTVADAVATQTGTFNSWGMTIRDRVTATSVDSPVTLLGLTDSRSYSCTISAVTGLGIGPESNTVSVTPTPDLIFSEGFEDY